MAPLLALQGFTAIWLPPAYKGSGGARDVGYGVYDLYDLGEFQQKGSVRGKYGTADEYIAAVRALRRAGLQTLADTVLGHRLGADEKERVRAVPVRTDNRLEKLGDEAEGEVYTRFTFPGRAGRYSDFVWDHRCFTGTDWNGLDPDHHLFLLDGKDWAQDVDDEFGNYDYLMGADVDVREPRVREELIRWARWYLERTGVDGFRLDAVKHISAGFMADFLQTLRAETGRELYAVGEYWKSDVGALHRYMDRTGRSMDLFDVPLHFHFHAISRAGGSYDMRRVLDDTLVSTRAQQAVTFVDNHDTQPGQALESWVDGWFKASAYGLILLRREGYPCVFWGDLRGIPAKGIGAVSELPALMELRQVSAYGPERDYFDDPQTVGFVREGDRSVPGSGLVFLCTCGAGGEKRMHVGRRLAGKTFRCVIGGQESVTVDRDGTAVFRVSGGGCSVYVPQSGPFVRAWRLMRKLRLLRGFVRRG